MYDTNVLVKNFNIPLQRIQDWVLHGFVQPTAKTKNCGRKNLYSIERVYCVVMFKKLLDLGYKRKTAAEYLSQCNIIEHLLPTTEYVILTSNKNNIKTHILRKGEKLPILIAFLVTHNELLHIINFQSIRNEVDIVLKHSKPVSNEQIHKSMIWKLNPNIHLMDATEKFRKRNEINNEVTLC